MKPDFRTHVPLWFSLLCLLFGMGCQPESKPANGPADEKLLAAALNNGEVGVKDALNAGANPNVHNEFGVTPLMMAALNGNAKIAARLLEAKAEVNLVDQEGWSALMKAIHNGHVAMVEQLCQKGADVHTRLPDGTTVLGKAFNAFGNDGKVWSYLNENQPKLISLLIDYGAKPDSGLIRRIDETLQAEPGAENLKKARLMLQTGRR